jgi:hypothetical protein
MQGEAVLYNGSMVSKAHFRTYVYGADNQRKLVGSWDEYERAMASGLWFTNASDVMIKPKQKKKSGGKNGNSARVCVSDVPADQCIESDDAVAW